MISLQSHNQVLYHLTQLTLAVTPRTTSYSVQTKKQDESSQKNTEETICRDSLEEAAKNCTELPKMNLSASNALRMKKNKVCVILDDITISVFRRPLEENKWRVSYLSGLSFAENKRDFPCSSLTEPVILPVINLASSRQQHRLLHTWYAKTLHNHMPIRTFKSQRSLKMELEQNPTLVSRIKKWLGLSSNLNVGLVQEPKSSDYEKLKQIFNNTEATMDEQKRIKIAFVEGYESGLQRQMRGRTIWLKVMQNIVIVSAVMFIIWAYLSYPGGGIFKLPMSHRIEIDPEDINVTFNDVKGVDEAKQELLNVVEFLKNPDKFSALGGKLPKGVLLVGPPGTGKTLLARAVAGEAGVPFFHVAGPEFDEILVGQGARRVRDLFRAAKEKAPCVVFIDEIDSVGAKRTNSVLHPYANQTINQLLSEMDGFRQNEGVIVLGATNRRKDLDKALMRPGRFDVEIYVNKPDYLGRKEILDLYLSKILTHDVDTVYLARCTTGFTGADLENMINQAALRAAIDEADCVTMKHLEYARDKVLMGPEGKLKLRDEEVNRITAYHEAGHALVAFYTKDATPLHKVTIVPRGPSLGHTSYMHEKDVYHITKSQLLANMDAMMGGRAAEELIFGPEKVTTGASSDLVEATKVAEMMVKSYGMSDKVGLRSMIENKKLFSNDNTYAPSTNELIDNEVKRLLQESFERAKTILKTHAKAHKQLAEALLQYETLDAGDVAAIANETGFSKRESSVDTKRSTKGSQS
ncbi:ATP-dependent zinc metalloprotease YME1L [Linepithema humile]|uniref:ATP-dependent zinc metalloprotease YME1L n=1 Tax=Linepithema humile TaxID=83485 RepID=UPI0006238C0B|nr:PREDICTED: ATP-dependent zinc metalloprotease YME1 homolog [Linepithema humile]XP_012230765.1 PREDICTED: ATP-dependent zinc metalloprotease YME1 homolog [Linepithema humile]